MSALERVLVTGLGGDFGQALVKALRLSSPPVVCHGCDMDGAGIGRAFVESFHVVPRAEDPRYVDALTGLCATLGINAVVPGSEQEIAVLSRLGRPPQLPGGAPVVCQDAGWIDTYGDKLACMRALSGTIALTPFADGTDREAVERLITEAGFPFVVKPRRSSGSRSVRLVQNRAELEGAVRATPHPLVQAPLDDAHGEFSVGAFRCDQFSTAIAFQRELGPAGCSWSAQTCMDEAVLDYAAAIVRGSQLQGSANIQVRKTAGGVRLLEVNPRFSSLVAARALCGFRDLEWSINLALGRRPSPPEEPFRPLRFRRFFHELVDLGEGFGRLAEWDAAPANTMTTIRR